MKLYQLVDDEVGTWFGTRAEAQQFGKDNTAAPLRGALRLREVNIETDKAGVIKILNANPVAQILRTWKLTNRGGLLEIK